MSASASDIVVVLTGGSGNTNPNLSLGGNPSATPIMGVLNNLFDNITDTVAKIGQTDYRCIYIFNNNSSDAFYNVKLYLDAIVADTNVKLGLMTTNEIQQIVILGTATGGSFNVNYISPFTLLPVVKTVNYDADPSMWGLNLQNALSSDFPGSTVVIDGNFSSRIFRITFGDFRNHDLLGVDITNLTGSSSGTNSKLVGGSPVNAIPPLLDVATTPPSGVEFSLPILSSPTVIGTLYPEEGFPVWLRRTSPAGAAPATGDGFTLKIIASPISS